MSKTVGRRETGRGSGEGRAGFGLARGVPLPGLSPAARGKRLETGCVLERCDNRWRVLLDQTEAAGSGEIWAERAAGCLLRPEPGDVALMLVNPHGPRGKHYVLNVLERGDTASELDFPGDVRVNAPEGRCAIVARDLDLQGEDTARLAGRELDLQAVAGRMRFARLDVLAKTLDAGVRHVKSVGETVSVSAARLATTLGRAFRNCGFELHRAGQMRVEVKRGFAVKASRASILAKDDVSIDADKVNLG